MKRTSKLLAALAGLGLALCIAPVTASAEIGYSEDGLWMYNIYEDGSAFSVTCQDKTVTEVEVPSEIDGHTVTMIEVDCFNGCEDLKTVKIPDTVTVIDDYSFYKCSSLENVEMPKHLKKIGFQAFYGCSSLTQADIPVTVEEIELLAWDGCTNMEAVHIDPKNQYYKDEDGVLFNKDGSTLFLYPPKKEGASYTVPASVRRIEDYAFIANEYLETIDLGQTEELGQDAMYYCTNLKNVTIPETVKTLDGSVFGCCQSLESVTIPDTIEGIGEGCFYGCIALRSVNIPANAKYIHSYAFFNCPLLKSLKVPASVEEIGDYAMGFYYSGDNQKLTRVQGFKVATEQGTAAFKYCADNGIASTGGVTAHDTFVTVLIVIGVIVAVFIIAMIVYAVRQKKKMDKWRQT